jgi:uncharacterized UPF0146 family protein
MLPAWGVSQPRSHGILFDELFMVISMNIKGHFGYGIAVKEKCIYLDKIHIIMSTSCVYTIRIPTNVRQIMDEMKDVNWQSDIRQAIEEMVKEKKRQTLLAEARELRKGTKNIGISASELIREDRDAR